jgi:hypothetical protein
MTDLASHPDQRHPRASYSSSVSVGAIVTEQAKGVLMLRYGINSYEALAVLARWAHESASSIDELSRALTHGVCQGHGVASREGTWLVRWLEQRLRGDVATA